MSVKLSREEVQKLTPTERIAYNKALNAERVKRYREANKDNKEYIKYTREYTNKYKAEHKEEYRKKNVEHNKTYRAKQQALKNADIVDRNGKKLDVNELIQVRKQLASQKIANNYKIHQARKQIKEVKSLKDKILEYKKQVRQAGRPKKQRTEAEEEARKAKIREATRKSRAEAKARAVK